jgi:hypothetical protein
VWNALDAVENFSYTLVTEVLEWWAVSQANYSTDEDSEAITPLEGLKDHDPLLNDLPLPSLNTVLVYKGQSLRMNTAPSYLSICEASYIIEAVEEGRLTDLIEQARIYALGYFHAMQDFIKD